MRCMNRDVGWLLLAWLVCHAPGVSFASYPQVPNNPHTQSYPQTRLAALGENEPKARDTRLDAMDDELARLRAEVAGLEARLQNVERPVRLPPTEPGITPEEEVIPSPASDSPWLAGPTSPPAEHAAEPHSAGYGDGYGEGLHLGFWGWVSYLSTPRDDVNTFWAWEAELDVTKSFTDTIAASADIDFVDTNNGARTNVEQLFVSFLLPDWNDAIFTTGKFNAPFGIEPRDFWDRRTGSTSLLFRAMPRDLTGLMLTQPLNDSGLLARAFVINGFDQNLDVNQQPSLGLMVDWEATECVRMAVTNYWGPEFPDNNGDKLYFVLPQVAWQITPRFIASAEYLYATTASPTGEQNWSGYTLIVSHTLTEKLRLFGQFSDLDDPDGFVTFRAQRQQQGSVGFAWYFHPLVESRVEYRHDVARDVGVPGAGYRDTDSFFAHLTFGY